MQWNDSCNVSSNWKFRQISNTLVNESSHPDQILLSSRWPQSIYHHIPKVWLLWVHTVNAFALPTCWVAVKSMKVTCKTFGIAASRAMHQKRILMDYWIMCCRWSPSAVAQTTVSMMLLLRRFIIVSKLVALIFFSPDFTVKALWADIGQNRCV